MRIRSVGKREQGGVSATKDLMNTPGKKCRTNEESANTPDRTRPTTSGENWEHANGGPAVKPRSKKDLKAEGRNKIIFHKKQGRRPANAGL